MPKDLPIIAVLCRNKEFDLGWRVAEDHIWDQNVETVEVVRLEDARAAIDAADTERSIPKLIDPLLAAILQKADRARNADVSVTCPSSRHVRIIAGLLATGSSFKALKGELPTNCAASMFAVLASLWEARARLAESSDDATRFQWMQDNPMKAQAFFWNYRSRKQRAAAIDAAMKEQGR